MIGGIAMAVVTRLPNQRLQKQKLAKTGARRDALTAAVEVNAAVGNGFGRNDLAPRLEIEIRSIDALKPAKRRTRKPTAAQIERVIQSIRRFGFVGPLLVKEDRIVDGHVRHAAAEKLGMTTLPCIDVRHLSDDEVGLLAVTVNRLAELGEWDLDAVKIVFEHAIDLNFDLSVTGFSLQEQDIILIADAAQEATEEQIPDPPEAPVTHLGDLFALGDHRIFCGNSLQPESYASLVGERQVTVIIADFPYNVRIANNVSGLGKKKHGEFVMASGEMSRPEFSNFLREAITCSAAYLIQGGVFFGFIDWRGIDVLIGAGGEAHLEFINLGVWNKGAGGMGALYRSAHELIPVFCKGGTPAINNVMLGKHGRDRSNVFSYPGANRRGSSAAEALGDHPTPKPVELCADLLRDVSHRGDAVLDPFLGSGTTIIAAEQTGRIGYGIELDPKYVDVAVRRWEQLTGRQAVHVESGLTFAELGVERLASDNAGVAH
jgi:DNA modification methylase